MNDINIIYDKLESIAPKEIIFLNQTEPFELLICVILSAQTTDENVNKVAPNLFSRYPTAIELSKANQKDVEEIIHSTGFYKAKARNIIACSKSLVDDFNNNIPDTIEELITLKGVGRKTANVIVGHIYNKGAIIVDTHFKRMCLRLGLTSKTDPSKIELEIKRILEESKQYRFSMTLNWFGRTYCKAKKPLCKNCILFDNCIFNKKMYFLDLQEAEKQS